MSAWGKGGSARSCEALIARVEANDPSLVDLVILPNKTFGAAEAERIAVALEAGQNTHLKSLSASGHALPPHSLTRLASALAQLKSGLVRLAIGHGSMGDEGVVAFCQPLESVRGGKLEVLDLAWKNISAEGMAAIGSAFGASRHLKELNLSRNENIRDAGMEEFCEHARTRCIELSHSVVLEQLEELDLSECGVGPAGLKALVYCVKAGEASETTDRRLSLTLDANPLGPCAGEDLAELISRTSILQSLSLARCRIGDEGLHHITTAVVGNPSRLLRSLNLSQNDLSEAGAQSLASSLWCENVPGWSCLEELSLAGNKLGQTGVVTFVRALPNKTDNSVDRNGLLRKLDLSETDCGIEGAIAALECTRLSSLRLFNNNLGSAGFEALAAILEGGHPSLVNLDLGGNGASQASMVQLLDALAVEKAGIASKLLVLEIGGNDKGFEVEEAVKRLQEVRPELDVARDRPKGRGSCR